MDNCQYVFKKGQIAGSVCSKPITDHRFCRQHFKYLDNITKNKFNKYTEIIKMNIGELDKEKLLKLHRARYDDYVKSVTGYFL